MISSPFEKKKPSKLGEKKNGYQHFYLVPLMKTPPPEKAQQSKKTYIYGIFSREFHTQQQQAAGSPKKKRKKNPPKPTSPKLQSPRCMGSSNKSLAFR